MSKAWSHLPNAHHIDWVLKSVRENSELWALAFNDIWNADTKFRTNFSAACEAIPSYIDYFFEDITMPAKNFSAEFLAHKVISALIAWDDCDRFLAMPYEKLKVWAVLSEDPRAVLLLSMVYLKEKTEKIV